MFAVKFVGRIVFMGNVDNAEGPTTGEMKGVGFY